MPTPIYLIKVGMNMTEGVVEEWYVPNGAPVEKGELLYRLETEKVNLDVEAETSGTVQHVVGEDVTMKPGDVVGYIYAAGEEVSEQAAAGVRTERPLEGRHSPGEHQAEPRSATPTVAPGAASSRGKGRILSSPAARRLAGELGVAIGELSGSGPGGRIVEADVKTAAELTRGSQRAPSSPIARRLARELEVDLDGIQGSGPGGRITKEDVERAAASTAARREPKCQDRRVPVKGMRQTIARRMHESLQSMAQLTMDMDVAMDDAVRLREQLVDAWREEGVRPGYTDLVIAAVARALEQHPQMNASFGDEEIVLHGAVNVGMAVALDEGLIVPVIRNANELGMNALVRETARLAAAAREGTLGVDDLQDGTFTVTALGMFGVDSFTPIVNAPQAGILGVNRLRDAVGWNGAVPVKERRMNLSLSWDHRALDGAPAARFLATVRELLEAPFRLLL